MTDNLSPRYETYCFIYLENEIVGKTRTAQEADVFCKLNIEYQWEHGSMIKNEEKRKQLYKNLPLFTG